MDKFGDNTTSFRIWKSPDERDRNRFAFGQNVSEKNDQRKNFVDERFYDSGEKKILKMSKFDASNSVNLSSTKTPENSKIPEIPKAPIKLRTKKFQKIEAIPKKLQFLEAEDENAESVDSGIATDSDNHRYPTRSKLQSQSQKKAETKSEAKNFKEKSKTKNKKNYDKENDINVATKKLQRQNTNRKVLSKISNNFGNSKNFETPEVSIQKEPLKRQLSVCESDDWKEHLRWLQPRRDVGVWIECCRKNCKKWRYTENYHDPVDVPEIWYCQMNFDKNFANCETPQQEIPPEVEEELIMNAYNAGSIVWGRINGYPWWPAMVDDCPDFLRYYETSENSKIPHKYHVIFFNKNVKYAWLPVKDIKPFAKNPRNTFIKKTKFRGKDYSKELETYCEIATSALSLTILERLQKFSYISRISNDNLQLKTKKKRKVSENRMIRIKSRLINANENSNEKNYQNFSKSKNLSKIVEKTKTIELITIDDEEIDEKSNNENNSFVDEFRSSFGNLPENVIKYFSESNTTRKSDDRKKILSNEKFEIPMEIENNSTNSFTADEFTPCQSNNLGLEEISPIRTNSSCSFEAEQRESFTLDNGESNFFNNENSSIGFSADEFEPRSSRSNNSFRNYNSQFDLSRSLL